MRTLFLDFDGVLNTENYQAYLQSEGKPGWDDFGMLFDSAAVTNLKRILDAMPDVRIVIESGWKVNGLDELRLMWAERGLPGILYDITPTFFCEELLTVDLSDPDNIRKVEVSARARRSAPGYGDTPVRTANTSSLMIWRSSTATCGTMPFRLTPGEALPNPTCWLQ